MELQIWVWVIYELLKEIPNDNLEDEIRYEPQNKKIKIRSDNLTNQELKKISEIVAKHYNDNVPDYNDKKTHNKFYPYIWLSRKIEGLLEIDNSEGEGRVKAVDQMAAAMKAFFSANPYKIVFVESFDDKLLPYLISDIKHVKPRNERAYVNMDLRAMKRGNLVTLSKRWDKAGNTVKYLLKEAGLILPTEEFLQTYEDDIKKYRKVRGRTGDQVNAVGLGYTSGKRISLTIDDLSTKSVIDDMSDDQENDEVLTLNKQRVHVEFWRTQDIQPLPVFKSVVDLEDEAEDTKQYTAYPIHPYINLFDLGKHRFFNIHVNNIEEYKWDHDLADKLILDSPTKNLISVLVNSTKEKSEDIIAGKMSGTIILATGSPGVGKTLTAEVFSEYIERSLYVVQCSQLGIDVDTIEGNLREVLDRAARWGSILLIDEADVYIRDRGSDIVHNAIVGVFLRLIEYYNGVLFMTSNRGDIIDDAIMSRATAWIQYKKPGEALLPQIWRVLSYQYRVKLEESDIQQLTQAMPDISGRTVRNLLKLVSTVGSNEDTEANKKALLTMSEYQMLA